MDLDKEETHDFDKEEENMPNIWSMEEEAQEKEEQNPLYQHEDSHETSSMEEDLEKPSFLRRLRRKNADRRDSEDDL